MIYIIDNRNEKQDLEIDFEGYGKWYACNSESGKLIGCKYKYEAKDIVENPENWDI
jgi:hypothetical protein